MSASQQPHSRLVIAVVTVLMLAGFVAWSVMPRQEDPSYPYRYAMMTIPFPGADPETVERLVVNPLEDELFEVSSVKIIDSVARTGVAVFGLELRGDVYDTDAAWQEVREAIDRAHLQFPSDVDKPVLNQHIIETEGILLALTGSTDPRVLREAARQVRRRLLHVPGVSRVELNGDPGEQITIEYDSAIAQRLGVTPRMLAAQLNARNVTIPGGTVRVGDTVTNLRPRSDFGSVDELRQTPVTLPSGGAVPLAQVAEVRRGPREPATPFARYNGERAIVLGVVLNPEEHVVQVGSDVRAAVEALQLELAPLALHEISFQPDYVESRLSDLLFSLLVSVIIVGFVLFLMMGKRLALVVTFTLPAVTLSALAVYWFGGGVLHQMSIAAFVIAMGMLVDNAIVVVEYVQMYIDEGMSRHAAARRAVRELALPLLSSTGTTIAAFVPMLLSEGITADFTRALPIVIVTVLGLSLGFALWVTPLLSESFLRPLHRTQDRLSAVAHKLGSFAVGRPKMVLLATAGALVVSMLSFVFVDTDLFPQSDRNQLLVQLRLPEGSHLDVTSDATRRVEDAIRQHPAVRSATSFVGRSVPLFYYNLLQEPDGSNLGEILVTTRTPQHVESVARDVRRFVEREVPESQGSVRYLGQGPAFRAPVELRLYGDPAAVADASERLLGELKSIDGATDARMDLDMGVPSVALTTVDAAAMRHGVSRSDVALAVLAESRGLLLAEFRGGDEPISVVLRSSRGEESSVEDFSGIGVSTPSGTMVPLGQIARPEVAEWRPAAIHHYGGERVQRVLSELDRNVPFGAVLSELDERLEANPLPEGVRYEVGGAAQGSSDANLSILRALPVGVLLMLVCLLWEFRSFRRVGIILVTVPLSVLGIGPGLLLSGEAFGFMSALGVLALAGIVVNDAIVLVDVADREVRSGRRVSEAILEAVRSRTRPVIVTSVTTIAGLVPLALSSSTLWPPLAFAMMSGLVAATSMTLLVVPALYYLAFRERSEAPAPDESSAGFDDEDTIVAR